MFLVKKLTAVAAVVAAGLSVIGAGVALANRPATAEQPPAGKLEPDWKQSVELHADDGKVAAKLTARIEKGWVVARYDMPVGSKVWEVVLARADGADKPKLTADETTKGVSVEYGKFFARDAAGSQLRILRQKKVAGLPAWPVVKPGESTRLYGNSTTLLLRPGKQWLWALAGPFANPEKPDEGKADVCLRLNHANADGGAGGTGRLTATAGGVNTADHGDTRATDDGELFVASYRPYPPPPAPDKPGNQGPPVAGRWAVYDADLGYVVGRNEGVVTLSEEAVTAADLDGQQCPGTFARDGLRLRFTVGGPDGSPVGRYEAVQDPATPRRMVGSVASGSSVHRLEFHWLAEGVEPGKPDQPPLPAARKQWLDLAIKAHHAIATATAPGRKTKPAGEQAKLVAAAVEAQKALTDAEPGLLRKLVADEPNTVHGFAAARELIQLAGRQGRDWSEKLNEDLGVKPGTVRSISRVDATADEVRAWVAAVRRYAATNGPQMEAGVVMRAARDVLYRPDYLPLAAELAAEADELAVAVGLPAEAVEAVNRQRAEVAGWTAQKNPPAAGTVWTVTVHGRVTDPAGKPILQALVVLNQFQNTEVLLGDDSNKVTTDADGRYTATVRCRGQRRVHLTGLWAEAPGFVKTADRERRPLLPGETATVDFTPVAGEKFAGVVKLPAETWAKFSGGSDKVSVWVKGPGVEEWLILANGERFELYLPAGKYTVSLDGFGENKLTWADKPTGAAEHTLRPSD